MGSVQICGVTYESFRVFHVNMGNVHLMIHLGAAAFGLGSQWVSMDPTLQGSFKAILGVPEEYHAYAVIPIGYPAYEPKPAYRREFKEILHFDKYDISKYKTDEQVIEYIKLLHEVRLPSYSY